MLGRCRPPCESLGSAVRRALRAAARRCDAEPADDRSTLLRPKLQETHDGSHRDRLCSFEVLIEDYTLGGDPALALMARVVHGADVSEDRDATPQSPGLLAIDDQRQLELELPVYDALYAWAQREVASRAS